MTFVAALGLARILYFHALHPGTDLEQGPPTIDQTYVELRRNLPPDSRLGFLSDLPTQNRFQDRFWLQASYALAPKLLIHEPSSLTWVLARMEHPSNLESLAASSGLRVEWRAADSRVALLRRIEPR